MSALLLVLALLSPVMIASGEDDDHGGETKLNPDAAVTAFDEHEGFKLGDKAVATLGVRFQALGAGSSWTLPKSALVRIKHTTGVYRRAEGWIAFVLVQVSPTKGDSAQVRSSDLQEGDEVAVQGVPFLRMTEADLTSEEVGHSH